MTENAVSTADRIRFVGGLSTAAVGSRAGVSRIDPKHAIASAQLLEACGFDQTIIVYASYSLDPFAVGSLVGANTEKLDTIIALRPNMMAPTVAAKAYATIDQINGGRTRVHLIAGGNESDQWRDGDFLAKDDRYRRMTEYIEILRRCWSEDAAFDHDGDFYSLRDYTPKIKPAAGRPLPISVGGGSAAAFRTGAAGADVFGFWAEPLADLRQQLDRLRADEAEAARTRPLDLMLSARAIIAPTDDLAWQRAHRILDRLAAGRARPRGRRDVAAHVGLPGAEASQRLLRIAEREEVHDGVLWTRPAQVTGAIGSSAALVGGYETVARALAAYYDLGFRTFSLRGYDDGMSDSVEQGQYVLPRVRELVAERGSIRLTGSDDVGDPASERAGSLTPSGMAPGAQEPAGARPA